MSWWKLGEWEDEDGKPNETETPEKYRNFSFRLPFLDNQTVICMWFVKWLLKFVLYKRDVRAHSLTLSFNFIPKCALKCRIKFRWKCFLLRSPRHPVAPVLGFTAFAFSDVWSERVEIGEHSTVLSGKNKRFYADSYPICSVRCHIACTLYIRIAHRQPWIRSDSCSSPIHFFDVSLFTRLVLKASINKTKHMSKITCHQITSSLHKSRWKGNTKSERSYVNVSIWRFHMVSHRAVNRIKEFSSIFFQRVHTANCLRIKYPNTVYEFAFVWFNLHVLFDGIDQFHSRVIQCLMESKKA